MKTITKLLSFTLLCSGLLARPALAAEQKYDPATEERITQIMGRMSLEEKVGQLLMVSFGGKEISPVITDILETKKPGAIALFARNITNSDQTARLIRDIDQANKKLGNLPLFVSLDQEGGNVVRVSDNVMVLPSNMALGATASPLMAYSAGLAQGIDLTTLGFNMNLAPVLDINSNYKNPVIGIRSFGENPAQVAEFGSWFVKGQQETGLISVAKHFPGHGDTQEDSHENMPVINADKERLLNVELVPFKAAIDAGLDAIVTAHIAVPNVTGDPKLPSTLSKTILTDILRKELGFDGVIISDGLEMHGILDSYGCGQAAVKTILAGGDMAMILWHPENKTEVFNALREAVENGTITMSRLEQSVRRILRLKIKRGIIDHEPVPMEEVTAYLKNNDNHRQLSMEIAYRSVTLLKNQDGTLPIKAGEESKTVVIAPAGPFLSTLITKGHIKGLALPYSGSAKKNQALLNGFMPQIQNSQRVVFGIINNQQLNMAKQLQQRFPKKKFIVVNMGTPYTFTRTPQASAYILTYGWRTESQIAAAETVLGLYQPQGKLPVSIPGFFKIGYGLSYPEGNKMANKTPDLP